MPRHRFILIFFALYILEVCVLEWDRKRPATAHSLPASMDPVSSKGTCTIKGLLAVHKGRI
jgi:hypothetical protein